MPARSSPHAPYDSKELCLERLNRRSHRYGAARDECRVTRERIETPSGRVIYRTKRECNN